MKTATPSTYRDNTGPTEIILEIQGLEASSDGDGSTFILRGVKPIEVDLSPVMEVLMNQGVARPLAEVLVDRAYEVIQTGLLADALASRMKRVG